MQGRKCVLEMRCMRRERLHWRVLFTLWSYEDEHAPIVRVQALSFHHDTFLSRRGPYIHDAPPRLGGRPCIVVGTGQGYASGQLCRTGEFHQSR